MNLTKTLIGYLHRVFNRDPAPFLALTIDCDGSALVWSITDGPSSYLGYDDGITHWDDVGITWDSAAETTPGTTTFLTLTPTGGSAAALTVDLGRYTISGLAELIASKTGYSVPYVNATAQAQFSAEVLLNGSGSAPVSLYGYTNLIWSYMDAAAAELETAQTQIVAMPAQMRTDQAGDIWLDLLGSYYGVKRILGELDAQYGPRIISAVVRPLGNNVAMESALRVLNGGLSASVTDYPILTNNSYGLFDVIFQLSVAMLVVQSPSAWTAAITNIIEGMRDAGTFLRTITMITPIQATTYIGSTVITGSTTFIYPS